VTGAPLISIVDDDCSVGEAIKGLMKAVGFDAEVFTSAEAFLDSSRLPETACVIADIQMPGLTGLDLPDRLVAAGRRIPIVFITAFPNDRAQKRALKAGAICLLSKPFSEEDLLACIRSVLPRDHGDGAQK
jgi:FixJ family two-component response regulator